MSFIFSKDLVDRQKKPKKPKKTENSQREPAACSTESGMIGGLLGEGSFLWEQTQLLLWAAAGTCSGGQDGALLVLWVPVPGSSHVLGAAPARWQEEFQALQCSMFSPCSCCCQGGLFQEVLIHQI